MPVSGAAAPERTPIAASANLPAIEPPAGPVLPVVEVERDLHTLASVTAGSVGLSLVGLDGPILTVNDDRQFMLASVAKLYILFAYLDRLSQAGRGPSAEDYALMRAMIVVSDNTAASKLWKRIGGPNGLASFLRARGLEPIHTHDEDEWGSLRASSAQVAGLISQLLAGRLLDPTSTGLSLSLMSQVSSGQRWGVSAGVEPGSVTAGLKDGWYPEANGWSINSAGIIVTPRSQYVLVILSDRAPSFREGVRRVERFAYSVNTFMTRDAGSAHP